MSKTWECGKCDTAGNVKPGTAAREVQAKKMVDIGIVGVDASPTLPHDRDAFHVELHVVGISNSRRRAVASLSLREVPLQLWWRRRPRSSMPNSDRMQSMSR